MSGQSEHFWEIAPLSRSHLRETFESKEPSLTEYLRQFALQNQEKGVARTFVAIRPSEPGRICGYYSIAAGSIERDVLPHKERKGLPRYPVPVAHIGRLSTDKTEAGKGLGEFLLMHALARCKRLADEDIGIRGIEVVALNEAVAHFYQKYGFSELPENKLRLYMPISIVKKLSYQG